METKKGVVHFSVSGEFIMTAARNFYYGEQKPEAAMKILSTVIGLSVQDAYKILNGDAQLVGEASQRKKISIRYVPDENYKSQLQKLLEHRKKQEVVDTEEDEERRDVMDMVLEDYIRLSDAEMRRKEASTGRKVPNRIEELSATRKNDALMRKFSEFAELYETNNWAYYDMDSKERIRHSLETEISNPYKLRWLDFCAGKNWIDESKYRDDDEIEVIDFHCLPVRKKLLDEYVNHIIDRLRKVRKKELREYDEAKIDFWGIRELEEIRRDLHGRLMVEAGFDPMKERITAEANVFKAFVEVYLEKKARTFGVM
jgi:hypothetical protein